MGIELRYANQCLKWLKPLIEEETGTRLEDIIVKDARTTFDPAGVSNDYMFVRSDYPNTIFMNEESYKDTPGVIPLDVLHELSHFVHDEIVKAELQSIKSKILNGEFESIKTANRKAKLLRKHRESFSEGFAEYMSMDYLVDDSPKSKPLIVLAEMRCRGLNSYTSNPTLKPRQRGYKFFKKVLNVLGEDKIFEVATQPPISEAEVKKPFLYLLKNYPTKTILSFPKYLIKNCVREPVQGGLK